MECIRKDIPDAELYYFCDNLNFPYGLKPDDHIIKCTLDNAVRFIDRYRLDMVVIACNTASTVALEAVRAAAVIPVVGVVPAIKPAAALSKSRTIALLATPATVRRPYTHRLIADFAEGCQVILRGSSLLVELAERKLRGETVGDKVAQEVAPLFSSAEGQLIDTVVLGCTHFPLLLAELQALRADINWIDSGPAIAARVRSLLGRGGLVTGKATNAQFTALFSAETPEAEALRSTLAAFGFTKLEYLGTV